MCFVTRLLTAKAVGRDSFSSQTALRLLDRQLVMVPAPRPAPRSPQPLQRIFLNLSHRRVASEAFPQCPAGRPADVPGNPTPPLVPKGTPKEG